MHMKVIPILFCTAFLLFAGHGACAQSIAGSPEYIKALTAAWPENALRTDVRKSPTNCSNASSTSLSRNAGRN